MTEETWEDSVRRRYDEKVAASRERRATQGHARRAAGVATGIGAIALFVIATVAAVAIVALVVWAFAVAIWKASVLLAVLAVVGLLAKKVRGKE